MVPHLNQVSIVWIREFLKARFERLERKPSESSWSVVSLSPSCSRSVWWRRSQGSLSWDVKERVDVDALAWRGPYGEDFVV